MVLTLTGPSGTGKSSIAERLLHELPRARLLRSYTTRPPRRSDLASEYEYVLKDAFERLRLSKQFEWTADYAGNSYGTRREDLIQALRDPLNVFISILVPERVTTMLAVARELKCANRLKSFFIRPPDPAVLVERMWTRGDKPESIQKRQKESASWERDAHASGIPYVFIEDTDGPLELKLQAIKRHLL